MTTTAHDELRARLDDYRRAVATYESPDPHDREEARHGAMHAARARLCDLALAEAMLAEHERLDAALALAYPKALQAAADVLFERAAQVDDVGEYAEPIASELYTLADAILDLSEEQIEAVDAAQREVTTPAQTPMVDLRIRVGVTADGKWSAFGRSIGGTAGHMSPTDVVAEDIGDFGPVVAWHWITARVLMPVTECGETKGEVAGG